MIKNTFKLALLASVTAGAFAAGAARAEEEGPLSLTANASVTSDYRFRGVSLNQESVAFQGGMDLSYTITDAVSFFAGTWASTGDKNTFGASEVDVYAGLTGSVSNIGWKLGGIGYLYPDAKGLDYYEIQGEVNGEVGPATAALGIFYAPDQSNTTEDNWYVYTNVSYAIPETPVTLKASLGYEDGAFAYGDSKLDWSIGASFAYKNFTLTAAYVDTNKSKGETGYFGNSPADIKHAGDAAVVFTLGASF
ncbi:TorF family putative porin [Parapedomonas caeni]